MQSHLMKSNVKLKYRLKEKLNMLPHEEYKIVMITFPQALKISQRTFHRYIYTRIDEKYSMPVDHLARLARFFNCRIEDLLNYKPSPLTGKNSMNCSKNDLANKLKLVK